MWKINSAKMCIRDRRYYDREEGRNEGRREAEQELIANMRKEGLSDELILRITKLTKEELEKIAE